MAKFDRQTDTAYRLLKKYGGTAQITRQAHVTTDPVTRRDSGQAATARTFACLGLPPGRSLALVPAELRVQVQQEFHLAQKGNQDFIPAPGDVLLWAGQKYRILWSNTYDPAGDGAIYTLAFGAA